MQSGCTSGGQICPTNEFLTQKYLLLINEFQPFLRFLNGEEWYSKERGKKN